MQATNLFSMITRSSLGLVFAVLALLAAPRQSAAQDCSLSCNNLVGVNIGPSCSATITPGMILEGEEEYASPCVDDYPDEFSVVISYEKNGDPLDPDNPDVVTGANVGELLYAKVSYDGLSCSGMILVEEDNPPSISCPADVIVDCGESVDTSETGVATAMDCYEVMIFFEDFSRNLESDCSSDFVEEITRTFVARSSSGRSASCSQTIQVRRLTIDDVDFPADRTRMDPDEPDPIDSLVVLCEDGNIDPENTGFPTINGTPINVMNGLCGISITYKDDRVNGCASNATITRTWTVIDKCAEGTVADPRIKRHDQTIVIMDMSGPQITCPDTLVVSTSALTTCAAANVMMPEVTVEDNCSGVVSVVMETDADVIPSNGGNIGNLPRGFNEVYYRAEDGCGQVSRCTTIVEVKDLNAPTLTCEDSLTVELSNLNNGILSVNALVEDVSDDCCANIDLAIRRVTGTDDDYAEFVSLDCADAGQVLTLRARATDCNGNSNSCEVPVAILDDIIGPLVCPPDITVSCTMDFNDPVVTGFPMVGGECQDDLGQLADFSDVDDFTVCGTGTITRTWSIEFTDGTDASCDQLIMVEDGTPVVVEYPDDYTTNGCGSIADLDPENLPAGFDEPVILSGSECSEIRIEYVDEIDRNPSEGCIQITRTWSVYDDCLFDPGDITGAGFQFGVQTLTIIDNTAPALDCPPNIQVNTGPDCVADVALTPISAIISGECFPDEVTTSVSSPGLGVGTFFQNVAPGNYQVIYQAADICGNTNECDVTVQVQDNVRPNAACQSMEVEIEPGGTAIVTGLDLNNNSSDNCTAPADLEFQIGPFPPASQFNPPGSSVLQVTCDDVGSVFPVAMWVGDEAGLWDFCETTIEVVDNEGGDCLAAAVGIVTGFVSAPNGIMVQNVELRVDDMNSAPVMTNKLGEYMIAGVSLGISHKIMPDRPTPFNEGVSTFDLVKLMQHLTGRRPLTDPFEQIAADVSGDDQITIYDAIIMQKIILNIQRTVRNNRSWRFVPRDYQFVDPTNALAHDFPEYLDIDVMESDYRDADFVGIKVGDINMSFDPTINLVETDNRSEDGKIFTLEANDRELTAGTIAHLALRADQVDGLAGMQFGLDIDPAVATITEVSSPLFDQGFQYREMDYGGLIVSGARMSAFANGDEDLIIIKLLMNRNARLSDFVQVNAGLIAPEVILRDDELYERVGLQWNNGPAVAATVSPNPFINTTMVNLSTPEAETVSWTVFNTEGRILSQGQIQKGRGNTSLELHAGHFEGPGVYFFQAKCESGTEVIKMVKQ